MARRHGGFAQFYPGEWARQVLRDMGLGGPKRIGNVRQSPTRRDYTGDLTQLLGHPPRPRRRRRKPPRQKVGLSPAGKRHNRLQAAEADRERRHRRYLARR